MLGWPGSWDKRKTEKVWLGQPEANPPWKTWFLTFFLISLFFPPFTRKIKTSSTTYDKQLSHKNRATAEARSLSFKVPRFFFFLTHEIQRQSFFFSQSFLQNTHKTSTPQSPWTQNSSTRVQSNSKRAQCSLSFFQHLSGFHTLLGLAYIDIWDLGCGERTTGMGGNAVDF